MKSKQVICVLIFSVALASVSALAEDTASSIRFQSLDIPCSSCRVIDDVTCEMSIDDESTVLPCADAAGALLKQLAASGYEGTPAPGTLRAFLLGATQPLELARPAFELLLKTEIGREIVRREASEFVKRYNDMLQIIVLTGPEEPQLWTALWQLPDREGLKTTAEFRAVLVHRHPKLGLPELLNSLSVNDIASDIEQLEAFKKIFTSVESPLAGVVEVIKEFLTRCEPPEPGYDCNVRNVVETVPDARQYLGRVRMQRVIRDLQVRQMSPSETVVLLETTDYEQFRTPDAHRLLLDALDKATRKSDQTVRASVVEKRNLQMLKVFSRYDGKIALATSQLLTVLAGEYLNEGQTENAIAAIEESFEVYARKLQLGEIDRHQMVMNLFEHPAVRGDEGLQQRVLELGKKIGEVAPVSRSLATVISVFAALLGGGLGAIVFGKKWRKREEAARREELQGILTEFGLKTEVSEAELTKAYRLLAKDLHPDAGGDKEAFTALGDKYERAKMLLRRFQHQ